MLASTYAPTTALQSRLQSTVSPVTISRGENHCFSDMFGNAFNQKTIVYTQCISTMTGIFSNGNWLLAALVFSLTTRIRRSMSPTCSLAAVVLISTRGTKSLTGSNSLSIMHKRTTNPPRAYKNSTFLRELASCLTVRLGRNSTVVNFIFLEYVTKNGPPATNITSPPIVTNLFKR